MSILECGALGVAEQVDFETPNTTVAAWGEPTGGVPEQDAPLIIPVTIKGQPGDSRAMKGPYSANMTIPTLGDPEGITGWMLKWLFRNVSSAAVPGHAGAYTHTYTSDDGCGDPYFFTIYNDLVTQAFNISGSIVSALSMTLNAGEELTMEWATIGRRMDAVAKQTPSIGALLPFTWADAAVELNSVSFTKGENFEFGIDRGGELIPTLNASIFAGLASQTGWTPTASLTIEFNDMDQVERFWGGTNPTFCSRTVERVPLDITFTSSEEIGSSGAYYTLRIYCPEATYETLSFSAGDPKSRIIQNIGIKPLIPTAGGSDITIELTNSESSYPDV